MRCVHPLTAWRTPEGVILFNATARDAARSQDLTLPCGQCIECRLEISRAWAIRCMHEAQTRESNFFATLTYKVAPRSLEHRDFQLFMKRLRKTHWGVRYFMCGEYGEQGGRPHFHAILFGLYLTDLKLHSEKGGNKLYTSEELDSIWQLGYASVGAVTMQSAQYVTNYITKRVTGEKALEHYTRIDPETGEIYEIEPEYAEMSRRPGIGKEWILKYRDDVYNYDHVIMDGKELKPPRYYDKVLQGEDPLRFESLTPAREARAKRSQEDNTPQRLSDRAACTRARLARGRRGDPGGP